MVQVSVRLTRAELRYIDKLATALGTSRNTALRDIIEDRMAEHR